MPTKAKYLENTTDDTINNVVGLISKHTTIQWIIWNKRELFHDKPQKN